MYNFLSKYRRHLTILFYILGVILTLSIIKLADTLFNDPNLYFYTSSTIVQGFMALVALLGAVVVFKVQLEDQAMQRLADGVESSVMYYDGAKAKTYTPTQMMEACKRILSHTENYGGAKDLIEKVGKKMEETLSSRNEIRSKMVDFTALSFLNIGIALVSLLFTKFFSTHWVIGGFILTANIYFAIFNLTRALQLVRSTMGYDFRMNVR